MEKLVFSRKGFDSDSGYGYSPYDPATGKYVLLPIPEEKISSQNIRYRDLMLKPDYLDIKGISNLNDLVQTNSLAYSRKSQNVAKSGFAHFDPMLGDCPWLDGAPNIGAFGQSEAAAGHLRINEVKTGSIFLFFSRFKPISGRVHPFDPEAGWSKGIYYIYGWLKVGKVITAVNYSELPQKVIDSFHPHSTCDDFRYRKNNTIFLPAEKLFDGSEIPGYGYFPRLTNCLKLSSDFHKNIPSIWRLPSFFNEELYRPTYLKNKKKSEQRWMICEDKKNCFVQTTGRGQEYISKLDKKSSAWIKSLFKEECY
ncbi:hypothetical protein GMA19_04205 [Paenibacillus polymyxa E681]|uniref:Nmad3 family putative nucleotide modification protein n=1 Tax=Paenibacillus polymyxa TaxID=1406 RepID=UPI0001E31AFB|nr:hypothetical protein [Paenibacillus polymyxa]ADM71975.1 hypothetical protein PPE_04195 [Paenibacillus polymyxa E681]QNV59009.1 hypothetical protein GE561_04216 [Paenibacillus polymyxa E681]QNV63835.1 hypothetical protein GMA19_04205 [Paenibacillus polymyxa E681]